jgi:hypothetical protein
MLGTAGTASRHAAMAERALDREIEILALIVEERGEIGGADLERLAGGRAWGPGRYRRAMREAVAEGRVRKLPDHVYGAARRREPV